MTDFTNDSQMEARPRNTNAAKREYGAYFAIIFLACLPLALFTYTLFTLRNFRLPEKDPVQAAWSQAGVITPMIFNA
ncbi:cytochrome PufQ [Octadecabacter sp.]|nr:cytochrome PufQ [Octadecabacter sp.]